MQAKSHGLRGREGGREARGSEARGWLTTGTQGGVEEETETTEQEAATSDCGIFALESLS